MLPDLREARLVQGSVRALPLGKPCTTSSHCTGLYAVMRDTYTKWLAQHSGGTIILSWLYLYNRTHANLTHIAFQLALPTLQDFTPPSSPTHILLAHSSLVIKAQLLKVNLKLQLLYHLTLVCRSPYSSAEMLCS